MLISFSPYDLFACKKTEAVKIHQGVLPNASKLSSKPLFTMHFYKRDNEYCS